MSEISTEFPSKQFASRLLVADSPSGVSEVLKTLESNLNVDWRPLGDQPNNYGTVQTQASNPMPCFVELKANADDAVLIRGFKQNAPVGVDPDDYVSMKEVADEFSPEDPDINVIADGSTPTEGNILNLTIRDKGSGQPQDQFEDTFLGLHTPGLIKQKYSFTQGQYGMGGTGVLQFCGDRNVGCYKFVASASYEEPGKWSWSLIRQNREENQYEYCVIDGEIPVFEGAFGRELAEKAAGKPAFSEQRFGSFVKVYDYRLNISKTDISGQEPFLYKFERYVVDSPLEVTLTETRYKNTSVSKNTTRGFGPSLKQERHKLLLERTETISYDFEKVDSDILGKREIHVILFKDDDRLESEETTTRGKSRFVQRASKNKDATSSSGIQQDHAVMFTVNGQTHGDQGLSFLKNRCGYSKIADDTVVIMGFDDFANPDMSDLFKPTRDRLQDGKQETQRLLKGLEEALKSSDMLSAEEDRRRAKRGSEDTEFDADSFETFVNENPEIAAYVNTGSKIKGPTLRPETGAAPGGDGESGKHEGVDGGSGDSQRFTGLKLPTYLRLISGYDPDGDHTYWDETTGTMEVELPVNQARKVRFGTDAQDNYLTRDILGGELLLSNQNMVKTVELYGEVLSLTIESDEESDVGDQEFLTVRLTRPDITREVLEEAGLKVEPKDEDSWDEKTYRALTPESQLPDQTVDSSPIYEHIEVHYTAEVDEESGGPGTPAKETDGTEGAGSGDAGTEGSGQTQRGNLDMPRINQVYREDWDFNPDAPDFDASDLEKSVDELNFDIARHFDETVTIQIDSSPDGSVSGLDLTINMDSASLRSFLKEKNIRDTWKPKVENQYRNAVVFFAISQYRELQDTQGETLIEREIGVADVLENCVNGMGQVMLPILFPPDQIEDMNE